MRHSQDHFSAIAESYHKGRFSYPWELFAFLCQQAPQTELAWDCATGSGQVAKQLSRHFSKVIASDISSSLLALAPREENIEYHESSAENSPIGDDQVDLITVGQAIHWFDHEPFFTETKRVLKPGGILAFWGYLWPRVSDLVDDQLSQFRNEIADYWPEKSKFLHEAYSSVAAPTPFKEIEAPAFSIQECWTVDNYLNHLASWSGTRYFHESAGSNPILRYENLLRKSWGQDAHDVSWPLILKVYRLD